MLYLLPEFIYVLFYHIGVAFDKRRIALSGLPGRSGLTRRKLPDGLVTKQSSGNAAIMTIAGINN